ncbi:MAG: hypothetical protein IRY97_05745, partial [Thermomicrobiaceae bacterium]|nr:hypothetical protein [Thermomicrobiaceae bacterium]
TLADGTPLLIGQLQAGGEVAFRGRAIALMPRATIGREAPGIPAQR